MKKVARISLRLSFSLLAVGLLATPLVYAQQTTESNNYSLEEVNIGPGGGSSESNNYGVQGTLGDIGAGESASANYNLLAGYTTDAEPTIAFAVTASTIDLGLLSSSTAATGIGEFSVGIYNADGYVVQTVSDGPSIANYELTPMTTSGTSSPGTEQFGINLVANTSPTTFGANPVQIPDSSFSSGYVDANYNTANTFRYVKGEVIAQSDESTGQTDFTVSYLLNISDNTPAGQYVMNHVMVATGTF